MAELKKAFGMKMMAFHLLISHQEGRRALRRKVNNRKRWDEVLAVNSDCENRKKVFAAFKQRTPSREEIVKLFTPVPPKDLLLRQAAEELVEFSAARGDSRGWRLGSLALKFLAAREEILKKACEENLGLAYLCAEKFIRRTGMHEFRDDLRMEAVVGLMRGLKRFDPRKGVKLSTYLWEWVQERLRRALGEMLEEERTESLSLVFSDEDRPLEARLGLPAELPAEKKEALFVAVQQALLSLPPAHREVIECVFGIKLERQLGLFAA